ncbi:MAG: PAS domain S-box protein [Deltaproteobacteria bacterium]|nr:PAS domain S-box protein [Deltaproteobacteria bacterium]
MPAPGKAPLLLRSKAQLLRDLYLQRKEIERYQGRCKLHSSELVEMCRQIKESEERYKRLLESVTSYVYTVTIREGEPVATSHGQGCEAVTGFTPEDYAADPGLWFRMIHDEDRPAVLDAAERILGETSPMTVRHRIHHKDGGIHWVRNTLVPHRDAQGGLLSYDGIILDISERMLAEMLLREQARMLEEEIEERQKAEESLLKFSHAVEQSPVSIVITDTRGIIQFANPKFTQMSGYSAKKAIGNTAGILKSGYTPPEIHDEIWHAISRGNTWEGEILGKKRNGELFWEHAIVSPIRSKRGAVTNYMVVKEDITERKHLEEQLRHAQKMEAIGQMAGGIAHDFNNILTVILCYGTQVQENFNENDPQRESIDQVLTAAERATNLTRSLLVFSRKEVMTPQAINLNDIVRNVEKFLRRIIGEDIQLITNCAPDRFRIYADCGQLEQILMNLAANARDAMPNGGVLTIETQLHELDEGFIQAYGYGEPGPYALLTVSDSGTGMDGETQKRIFDPFFTTKEVGRGTGLGLSVVYGIVQQHKGHINVYSEPGMGSTFKILIPLFSGESHAESDERFSVPAGGTETILVAEDDPAIRKLVESRLRSYGYDVILAKDGVEAVEEFRANSERISLALLDMLMPRKSGWEASKEIKRLRPDARTLFMSGYSQDLLQSKGLCERGSDILLKPFVPSDLARKVREALDG